MGADDAIARPATTSQVSQWTRHVEEDSAELHKCVADSQRMAEKAFTHSRQLAAVVQISSEAQEGWNDVTAKVQSSVEEVSRTVEALSRRLEALEERLQYLGSLCIEKGSLSLEKS